MDISNLEMTQQEFKTIASYIEKNVGIKMPEQKKVMMQSRLAPRLRKLGFTSYSEYINYVFNNDTSGDELTLLTDALTTNKTDFFREPDHFDYLSNTAIPTLINNGQRNIKIWSAGCSSGEEPYTLSIVLKEFMAQNPRMLDSFNILATDISTKVLNKAINAVYDIHTIDGIPLAIKKKYFLKSLDKSSELVRVKPELRSCVSFGQLNFMNDSYNIKDMFQVIFCRNVLIYFEKQTQEAIIRKFLKNLEPNGYLFLGHSETILSMNLPLETVAPTVYRKIGV